MKSKPTRAEIVIMAAGAAGLIFSLFAFYSAPVGDLSVNAWDTGLFPIATYPALAGVLSGGVVALRRFAGLHFSATVGGFTWLQIHLLLAIFAGLVMGGYLIANKSGADFGIGFWGMLVATGALIAGAVMLKNEWPYVKPRRG
ncbi:MAG: hypothetical protein ABJC79_13100 [Acidimicrobiia bacterium]